MRGRKISDEVREEAMALLATTATVQEVADKLGLSRQTVSTWRGQLSQVDKDELGAVRLERRAGFVRAAWATIGDAMELGARRVRMALTSEGELDELLAQIARGAELTQAELSAAQRAISGLQVQSLREISTYIGTIYDKAALAGGEDTERAEVRVVLGDAAKYAE